ncbi:hypothetical protein M0Q50_10135 [bacterium]|jgi:hypothetical protein|nr:hypothetical protein [bacterium]
MKYLKLFEKFNKVDNTIENTIVQQPFYVSSDRMWISDDIAKKIIDEYYSHDFGKYSIITKLNLGFKTSKDSHNYKFSVNIKKRDEYINNKMFGEFKYHIDGSCGDSGYFKYNIYGSNKFVGKRGVDSINNNIIIKLYPIWKYVKDGMKRLKNGEKFFDIIENSIRNNPEIAKNGIPDELMDILDYFGDMGDIGLF